MKMVLCLSACVALLVGCPPPPPSPQAVQITSPGSLEAEGEWQVHVVRVENVNTRASESAGSPVQAALVAWIGSWQNLEIIDFENVQGTPETGNDLVIVARKRR